MICFFKSRYYNPKPNDCVIHKEYLRDSFLFLLEKFLKIHKLRILSGYVILS